MPRSSPGPLHSAAELLAARGMPEDALVWFDRAVEVTGRESVSHNPALVAGRRRVRERLGLPVDQVDALVDLPEVVHVLFWPRSEVTEAHRRWPEVVEHDDADTIMRDRELENREIAGADVRIVMVPVLVADLANWANAFGADPLETSTRAECAMSLNEGIAWPPECTAPCWCGSGATYEKCCRAL